MAKIRVGEPCKFCLRPITQSVIAMKKAERIQNALNTVEKLKAKGGPWAGGRKMVGSPDEIKRLRKSGMTMREISKRTGSSTTTIQKVLKS